MKKLFAISLFSICLLLSITSYAQTTQSYIEYILKTVMDNDLDSYKKGASTEYANKVTKDGFSKVVDSQQKSLKEGFKLEFLGPLKPKNKDHILELWKVSYTNDTQDLLIRIWIKDNKYDGVWFHW